MAQAFDEFSCKVMKQTIDPDLEACWFIKCPHFSDGNCKLKIPAAGGCKHHSIEYSSYKGKFAFCAAIAGEGAGSDVFDCEGCNVLRQLTLEAQ